MELKYNFYNHNFHTNDEYKEMTQHGPLSFPVAFYHTMPSVYPNGVIALHWHDEFQFCLGISGEIEFTCEQKPFLLHENEALLINSNHLHQARTTGPSDSAYFCCAVHPRIMRTFEGSTIDALFIQPFINSGISALFFTTLTESGRLVIDGLKHLEELQQERVLGYQMLIISELMRIWQSIIVPSYPQLAAGKEVESIDQKRMKAMMSFIHEHYSEPLSLTDIAESVSLSKGECCRVFKRVAGSTPFEYLMLYRIKQSITMLESTANSIGDIALSVGFNSFSYFASCFKKVMGSTPKDYRKTSKKFISY